MKKFLILPFLLLCIQIFAQIPKKISTYLFAQYTQTTYDITLNNNPWGAGLGVQAFYNNKTKFKPCIEITGDVFLQDDKVLRIINGIAPEAVRGMVNIFTGSSFHPVEKVYLAFLAGPAFINSKTYLGIKPSFGFYFSKNKRWTAKASYTNIFNRDRESKTDFGSVSFAIGLKLF